MHTPEVDGWFEKRAHPLEEAMQAVRDLALDADPRIVESIKWSTPTFSYKGNIFGFNPAKNLVSLLFHTGAKIPGDHPGLEGDGRDSPSHATRRSHRCAGKVRRVDGRVAGLVPMEGPMIAGEGAFLTV